MPARKRRAEKMRTAERNKKRAGSKDIVLSIADSELEMPAGFTADGARMATLGEVFDPAVPTRSFLQLSEDHRFDVAAKRIGLRPETFQLIIPGHGVFSRAQAISEVRGRTKIGRHLVEVEELGIARTTKLAKARR